MLDKRVLVLAAVIAGLFGSASRGDAILSLGVNSNEAVSWPSTTTTTPSSNPSGGFSLLMATTTSPGPSTSTGSSQNLAASDPTNQPAPAAQATNSPVAATPTAQATATASASRPSYDAYVNLGAGPFPNASTLTTGNAQAWFDSPAITKLFGGTPTAQQQSAFDSTVLQRVEQTFALSGVPVKLTDDPNATAAHTLSVVSNAVNPNMTGAIGMTYLGGNGFHFIDNSANYAQSVDQLEWIVAHNVAHELMLAFGVPEDHDQTGRYIDSTVGQMAMFLNPNATFSAGAVQDLLSKDFDSTTSSLLAGAQLVEPSPVPEPTTWAAWTLTAAAGLVARRSRSRRAA